MKKQKLPDGLTHEKLNAIIAHYENQTDEEAEAEIEAAFANPKFSMIQVPVERVDDVRQLLANKSARSRAPKARDTHVAESRKQYGK